MDSTQAKPNRTLSVFRLLNAGSVAVWFFYTKSTIGTPIFSYLVALHAFATWGFAYIWYQHNPKNAGLGIVLVTIMAAAFSGWFFFYGKR